VFGSAYAWEGSGSFLTSLNIFCQTVISGRITLSMH
jgi:hypothetical protein